MPLPYVTNEQTISAVLWNNMVSEINASNSPTSSPGDLVIGDATGAPTAWPLVNQAAFNVKVAPFGALGNGGTDDRAAIQAALDAASAAGGGVIFFPKGTYLCNQSGANPWCLDVPSNVTLQGVGPRSIIKLPGGVPNFTRLLRIQGKANVRVTNLAFDGNKAANNATYEHNHCIFVFDSDDITIDQCWTYGATGDGISVTGTTACSSRVTIDRVIANANVRNAITVEQVNNIKITRCILDVPSGSGGSAIDFEPYENVALSDAYIAGNSLFHADTFGYVLTLGGTSPTYPFRDIMVANNRFGRGKIKAIWCERVVIEGNTGYVDQLYADAHSRDVTVRGNTWTMAGTGDGAIHLVWSLGQHPEDWIIEGNRIRMTGTVPIIALWGARRVRVAGNRLTGNGATYDYGVHVYPTQSMNTIAIVDNQITNVGRAIVVDVSGSNTVAGLEIGGTQVDTTTNANAAIAVSAAGSAAFVTNFVLGANTVRNAAGAVFETPLAMAYVTAGIPGQGATWSCYGTPEGAISEIVGAQALRRDGGASTTLYVKTSNPGGSTGWTAK